MSNAELEIRRQLKTFIDNHDRYGCYQALRRLLPTEIFAFLEFRQPRPPKRIGRAWSPRNSHPRHNNQQKTPAQPAPLTEDEKKLLDGCSLLLEKHREEQKTSRRKAFEVASTLSDLQKIAEARAQKRKAEEEYERLMKRCGISQVISDGKTVPSTPLTTENLESRMQQIFGPESPAGPATSEGEHLPPINNLQI